VLRSGVGSTELAAVPPNRTVGCIEAAPASPRAIGVPHAQLSEARVLGRHLRPLDAGWVVLHDGPVTFRFDGRAVIVTGAGNGLGRAYALELARRGARVVVNDLGTTTDGVGASAHAADFVVSEIRRAGGTAVPSHDSIAEVEGCERLAATALDAFGSVDVVVHNAGILRNAPLTEMTDERFWPVVETHLAGAFFLTRAVLPAMIERSYGRIVFTSSASGVFGRPDGANYAAAKAGVIGLCNAVAIEGEPHGILANAVLPVAVTRLAGAPDAADQGDAARARRAELEAGAPRMGEEWVVPMVVYLASEACTGSQRYYSAVSGRYARVFVGVTTGWCADGERPPTAEDLAAQLGAIEDLTAFDLPRTTFEEVEIARRRAAPGGR
jgi:NAD(P)-dependent dehydrogenase (short-subunit alcohol dehydrogenase family)